MNLPQTFIRLAQSDDLTDQQTALLFMAACKTNKSERVGIAIERIVREARVQGRHPLHMIVSDYFPAYGEFAEAFLYDLRCKNQIAETLCNLAVRFAAVSDLRGIASEHAVRKEKGIGPKLGAWIGMAFCGTDGAVLDVHVLAFLKAAAIHGTPDQTPQDPKEYARLAKHYKALRTLYFDDMAPAEADLYIWNLVRERGGEEAYHQMILRGPRLPAERVGK